MVSQPPPAGVLSCVTIYADLAQPGMQYPGRGLDLQDPSVRRSPSCCTDLVGVAPD